MTTRTRLGFGLLLAASLAMLGTRATADGPFIGANSLTASFSGYKCVVRSNCPEGIVLGENNGDHNGCSVSGHAPTCVGDCFTCGGNEGNPKVCTASSGNTCVNDPTIGRIFQCGMIRKHESGCTANQPTGVPSTPNGCFCRTDSPFVNTGNPCMIQDCQQ